jgi:peptidoglycan/xylan/chitin deacetylase (PgdA/CDA1 family)
MLTLGFFANMSHAAPLDYRSIEQDSSAVVAYSYFQIDEDAYPDMSLRFDTFRQHIETVENEDFLALSPDDLFSEKGDTPKAHKSAADLDRQSILISFETGHKSIMAEAVPLLLKKRIPFTVFISPAEIDQKQPYIINWANLKKLRKNPLVTIGLHSASYKSLADYPDQTTAQQAVLSALSRYKEVFGEAPLYYAYPYGDYDTHIEAVLKKNGIKGAFGLHSGAIYAQSEPLKMPRFTMTDNLGSNQRFIDTAYNLPLPHFDMMPQSSFLTQAPASLSFSVPSNLKQGLKTLQCFHSGIGQIDIEKLGELRIQIPLPDIGTHTGRLRINCTINAGYDEQTDRQRWRWHGMLNRIQ